jgi:hypothetical protein
MALDMFKLLEHDPPNAFQSTAPLLRPCHVRAADTRTAQRSLISKSWRFGRQEQAIIGRKVRLVAEVETLVTANVRQKSGGESTEFRSRKQRIQEARTKPSFLTIQWGGQSIEKASL